MTQDQLCDAIGVSKANINRIENGSLYPNLEAVANLQAQFNLNTNWLIGGEGGMVFEGDKQPSIVSMLSHYNLENKTALKTLIGDLLNDKVIRNEMIVNSIEYKNSKEYQSYLASKKESHGD